MSTPAALAACSMPSAAMKVCAMPVGQAVTATSSFFGPAAAGAAAAAAAAGAAAAAAGASSGPVAWLTRATISAGVLAERSPSRNSARISERASLASRVRCASSEPVDAAIMKQMSAGPSAAPKSTFGESRANASVFCDTAAERQCGIAMPPPRPVTAFSSRARASAARPSASARPALATSAAKDLMTSVLVGPRSTSSNTRSVLINAESAIVDPFLFLLFSRRS